MTPERRARCLRQGWRPGRAEMASASSVAPAGTRRSRCDRGMCHASPVPPLGGGRRPSAPAAATRKGAALALALLAVLAAALLGSALMANTGSLGHKGQMEARQSREAALLESALGIAVQMRLVRGDTAEPRYASRGAPDPYDVRFDTVGIWLRGIVTGGSALDRSGLTAWLARPVDSLFRQGLVLLPEWKSVQPSAAVISKEFSQLDALVRQRMQAWKQDSVSADCRSQGNVRWWEGADWPACALVEVQDGDFAMEAFRIGVPGRIRGRRFLRVQGAVSISGSLVFDTLRIEADGPVRLAGSVRVAWLEVYSRTSLELAGEFQGTGVLVADSTLMLAESARLTCCAYAQTGTQLIMADQARLEGYGSAHSAQLQSRARLLGALFVPGTLENQGFIGGLAIARQTENTGEVEPDSLPADFLQSPFLNLGGPKRYTVWRREL